MIQRRLPPCDDAEWIGDVCMIFAMRSHICSKLIRMNVYTSGGVRVIVRPRKPCCHSYVVGSRVCVHATSYSTDLALSRYPIWGVFNSSEVRSLACVDQFKGVKGLGKESRDAGLIPRRAIMRTLSTEVYLASVLATNVYRSSDSARRCWMGAIFTLCQSQNLQ